MSICANCNAQALYTYQVNSDILIQYCSDHLPHFLLKKRDAGQLPLISDTPVVEEAPVVEEPAPKSSKKKAADPVVEDAPVEAPVDAPAEEAPVEETTEAPVTE